MEKIDEKEYYQIYEEANIILKKITQAIPENSRAISVIFAVAQTLKNIVRQLNGNISEVAIREIILEALDVLGPESAQSQI